MEKKNNIEISGTVNKERHGWDGKKVDFHERK